VTTKETSSMDRDFEARLTIPADTRAMGLAQAFAREAASLARLTGADAEMLVLAVEEAVANSIEHAFDPGEKGTLELGADLSEAELVLSVRDHGLPFDASLAPDYRPPAGADVANAELKGLGLHLIRSAVDEVTWIGHGRDGKELRLVKKLSRPDITEILPGDRLVPFRDDVPQAPEQEYTCRPFHPEDAIQISQCAYRTYGYSYEKEDLYYPDRLVRLHASGELLSTVALDDAGQLVGYVALSRPGLGPVAEACQAIVAPAHRGRSLLGKMSLLLAREGSRAGLKGLYSEPATMHVFSQKPLEQMGFAFCGLTLGCIPRSRFYKQIQTERTTERKSLLLYFRYLEPPAPAALHAPERHRELLERIYAGLGAPVTFAGAAPCAGGAGEVDVTFSKAKGTGKISVKRTGKGSAVEIRRAARDLSELAGAEQITLELPLADPLCPELCLAAEEEGFFFTGVGPLFGAGGDVLRLQRLHVDLDASLLQVWNPLAKETVAYAVRERERVAPGRS
jgi:serine/threonine-protein kinase RsbW